MRIVHALLAALALAGSTRVQPAVAATSVSGVSARTRATVQLDAAYQQLQPQQAVRAHQPAATTQYNADVANHLYWHSVSAYCTDDAKLHDWTCKSCLEFGNFTLTTIMDDTANQGYVGYFTQGLASSPLPNTPVAANEPFVVVSFRGTLQGNLADWIEDLNFAKTDNAFTSHPDVHVHAGFWGAYNDTKADMLVGVNKAIQASGARAILFTGHSLGGAMAELAALDLKLNYHPDLYMGVYTQGTPRAGDAAFASLYSSTINTAFRETHWQDVVPHLPPTLLGFQHASTEVWWDEQFQLPRVCSATNGEDSTCADSQMISVSVQDHLSYHNVAVAAYCSGLHADQPTKQPLAKLKAKIVLAEQ